jgi:hypothetical protein
MKRLEGSEAGAGGTGGGEPNPVLGRPKCGSTDCGLVCGLAFHGSSNASKKKVETVTWAT